MSIVLTNYTGVVLDDTFFTHEIPQELHPQIRNGKVLLPRTLGECITQNEVFLDDTGRKLRQHNGSLLPPEGQTAYMGPYPDLDRSLCWLSEDSREAGERYLYITGNQLSIQKTILLELALDIFDLKNRQLIPAGRFQTLKASVDFQTTGKERLDEVPLPDNEIRNYERANPAVLFDEAGKKVRMKKNPRGQSFGGYQRGSEAKLYFVEDRSDCLAKVLFVGKRYRGKAANIEALQKLPQAELPWAMLPQERLFWDPERKHFAGYLQKYARNTASVLTGVPRFDDKSYSYYSESCVTALDTALKLTRQCMYLNNYGIYPCDFNPKNFAFDLGDDRFLIMWDTDSFCGGDYFSGNLMPEISSYRLRDVTQSPGRKLEVIDMCTEQLYAAVYWIVTLQSAPWEKDVANDRWYYVDPGQYADLGAIVPARLQELFWQVFEEGALPSADLLLHELAQARKELDPQMTYEKLIQSQQDAVREPEPDSGKTEDSVKIEPLSGKDTPQPATAGSAEIIWSPLLEPVALNYSLKEHFSAPLLSQMQAPKPVLSNSWGHGKNRTPKMGVYPRHPYQQQAARRFDRFHRMTGKASGQTSVGCYLPLWRAALLFVLFLAAALWVALTTDFTGWFRSMGFSAEMTPEPEGFLTEWIRLLKELAAGVCHWIKGTFAALRDLF